MRTLARYAIVSGVPIYPRGPWSLVAGPFLIFRRALMNFWKRFCLPRVTRGVVSLALGLAGGDAMAASPAVFVPVPGHDGTDPGAPVAWAVGNEVVVRFKAGGVPRLRALRGALADSIRWLMPAEQRALARARVVAPILDRLAVVTLPPGTDLATGLAELTADPQVEYAEPNLRMELAETPLPDPIVAPNDFEFAQQWSLHNAGQTGGKTGADLDALHAWAVTTGSTNVVAAIVDTGMDFFHPDLAPNAWINPGEIPGNGVDDDGNGYVDDIHGYDFVSNDGDPMDDNIHGTHVAGILGAAGDDENGIAGVTWRVRLMAVKAFDEAGSGTLDDTLSAIGYALAEGARIINASWGTTVPSRALAEVVGGAVQDGVVFIAAAGNNGSDVSFYPAALPEAIAVGASNARDESPGFSNFGSFVDLVAPGDSIYSAAPNASWAFLSGTSMAAPHVSGVAALLLSVRPDFTPSQIRAILTSTAHELETDRYTGAGRVDAARAVQISEPLPDAELAVPDDLAGIMDLQGAAGGHRFAGYRMELGSGQRPGTWQVLAAGGTPAEDGVVVHGFDTTALDDGVYALRLLVTNTVGQTAVARKVVHVRNVVLSEPLNNDVLRLGEMVAVRGTVGGQGRQFEVAWGVGKSPETWETRGMDLIQGGISPLEDELLAWWDTGVVPTNSFLTLRLTARRDGRVVGESFARMVHLEPRLRPGWPRYLPFSDEFPPDDWREFNVADLFGDGRREVVLVDHGEADGRPPRLRVFDPAGSELWRRDLPTGAPEHDAPVIGDLDGDGRPEIVVDSGADGEILAFHGDGRPVGGGWPARPGGTHFGKLLADLDGDGRLEVVAVSSPPPDLVSVQERSLVVLSSDGTVLRRWRLDGCSTPVNAPEQLPAVANLDEDPPLEIVAVNGCHNVSAFDLDVPDGPVWTAETSAHLVASPVVADLEGDGLEEVIIGGEKQGKGTPGGLYLFEHDGKRRPGWPVLVEESFESSAALADLDGDGWLDILVAGWDAGTLHAVRADGFELRGWPIENEVNALMRSVPVAGDVDGDGHVDAVLPSPGYWLHLVLTGDTSRAGGIRAWRFDGSKIDFQPLLPPDGLVMESAAGTNSQRFPPAVLTDLDGDGWLDVVASTTLDRAYSPTPPLATPKMRSSLYAWSLPVAFSPDHFPWPTFQGGPGRSGRYVRPRPVNRPPVIHDLPDQTVDVGGAFHPLALDRYVEDPDGGVRRLSWSARGQKDLNVEIQSGRVLVVSVPDAGWAGTETIELTVRDPAGGEASASVVFSVIPGYQGPNAVADVASTDEENPVAVQVLANDTSPTGRPLRVAGVSRPAAGSTVLLADGSIEYTPAPNFFGQDSFEYTLADDDGGFAFGEVQVEVRGINDPPSPSTDRLILDEDTTVDFDPLTNDADVDGDILSLVAIDEPTEGHLQALGGTSFRFVPPPDYFGVQSFSYVARDPLGLTATGEVAILVKPVNDPPRLQDQVVTANRNRSADVIYDAFDPDGDPLVYTVIDGPTNGVLFAYPTVANYSPRKGFTGSDRFTYTATDGVVTVGPATVTLTVTGNNNPPEVDPVDTVTAVDQEITLNLQVRDADDDPVALRVDRAPAHGSVRLAGTRAVYMPEPAFIGMDAFSVRGSDGKDEGLAGLISIRVTDENTAPVAQSAVLTVPRNQTSTINLQAVDAENNPLTYLVVTNPVHGALEGTPPTLSYVPAKNFRGLDHLWFTARDRSLTSEVAVVHLLVRDPNVVPAVTNQTVFLRRDQSVDIRLEVIDPDGQLLQSAILKGPKSGTLYGLGVEYRYQPKAGFEGRDSFTFRVWDGFALSAEGSVSIVVEQGQSAPPQFTSVRRTAAGVELSLEADPGLNLLLETSEDLVHWEPLITLSSGSGTVSWIDAGGADSAWRFYRASVPSGAK